MAWIERRGGIFRLGFRFDGVKYVRSLETENETEANACLARAKETIRLVKRGRLAVPEGCDIGEFILADGKPRPRTTPIVKLKDLEKQFLDAHAAALEANTRRVLGVHFGTIRKVMGNKDLQLLSAADLQEYVNERAEQEGIRGKRVKAITIRHEVGNLRAAWNWAIKMDLIRRPFPGRGLRYPKEADKAPFQTWEQIERKVAAAKLDDAAAQDLWDCLYLDVTRIKELLEHVRAHSSQPFLYPMFCLAAYTGARRSEMMRAQPEDVDLEQGVAVLRERKRNKSRLTIREVQLPEPLAEVLRGWLKARPEGTFLFTAKRKSTPAAGKKKKDRQLTESEVQYCFTEVLRDSKWSRLRGWHVLRHSFVSNLASAGVDQRIIDEAVGHSTEEMRRRYRHLFPAVKKAAIAKVYG